MIKVIVLNPQAEPMEMEIAEGYKNLQALVGGMIEGICLDDITGYCNEEGLLMGLPPNVRCETGTLLVGTLVFTRTDEEGETVSVKPGDLQQVKDWLSTCDRPGRFDYGF